MVTKLCKLHVDFGSGNSKGLVDESVKTMPDADVARIPPERNTLAATNQEYHEVIERMKT